MPETIVNFRPDAVEQELVDRIKALLPKIIAEALSAGSEQEQYADRKIPHTDVCVKQYQFHPTDQNTLPIEIIVNAGRRKDRSPEIVRKFIEDKLRPDVPIQFRGDGCGVWVRFHEYNSYGFA